MVDSDFEALDRRYIRRDEFENIFNSQKDAVRQLADSHDAYLRTIEYRLEAQLSKLEVSTQSFMQIMKYQSDFNDQASKRDELLAERLGEHEQSITRLEANDTMLFDSLFGNSARPDAAPSLSALIREGFSKGDHERDELKEEIISLKETVEQWQSFFVQIKSSSDAALKWALKTTLGRIATVGAASWIIGRIAVPEQLNQIGDLILIVLGLK